MILSPPVEDRSNEGPGVSLPAPVDSLAEGARRLAWRILEAGFLLIALIVLIYLLLGAASGPFVLGVVANLGQLVQALTPQALIGVAIVLAVMQVLNRPRR